MPRHNAFAYRLARLEAAARSDLWYLTLDDGRAESLPVGAVLIAMREALARLHNPDVANPPLSRELLLLARVAEGTESSVLGASAIALARQAVEEARCSPGTGDVAGPTATEGAAQ